MREVNVGLPSESALWVESFRPPFSVSGQTEPNQDLTETDSREDPLGSAG